MVQAPYTLEQAEEDIANLRGQVDQLTEILKLVDSAADWANTGSGAWLYSLLGQLKYASTDGNNYDTGKLIQSPGLTQQFTLAAAVAISGLSVPLAVGNYHVHVKVFYVPSGTIGSSHNLKLSFTGTVTATLNGHCFQAEAANAVQQVTLNNGNFLSTLGSPTHVAFPGWMDLDADLTVQVAGTLVPQITLGVAGDDITISPGTFWEITPTS